MTIKPDIMMALFATSKNDAWLGRICRALGGQDVKLDEGQRTWVEAFRMTDVIRDERRKKETDRKRKWRAKVKAEVKND